LGGHDQFDLLFAIVQGILLR